MISPFIYKVLLAFLTARLRISTAVKTRVARIPAFRLSLKVSDTSPTNIGSQRYLKSPAIEYR